MDRGGQLGQAAVALNPALLRLERASRVAAPAQLALGPPCFALCWVERICTEATLCASSIPSLGEAATPCSSLSNPWPRASSACSVVVSGHRSRLSRGSSSGVSGLD